MAFEGLGEKLQNTFKKLKGKGKLTEKDIKEAMREVKLALLEADVSYKVVKKFVSSVSEKCVGSEVLESLTPGQQVVKIVNDELTELMGTSESKINFSSVGITVIMLVGLQGAGKTTMCGKLANKLRKDGKKPLLVACDIYRPAAIKQLEVVGKQINIPVFSMGDKVEPVKIVKSAMDNARENGNNVVIIDTAGRLHIDEALMQELKDVKEVAKPNEILLVVDSMTGQDAINVAQSFNDDLDLTGVILTKLDGDTRGGVALSVRHLTNLPIKFIGTSEKLDGLSSFDPERMAGRILDMGDIISLVEQAEEAIDEKAATKAAKRLQQGKFDLEDFLTSMKQIKKLGPLENLIKLIPGAKKMGLSNIQIPEKQLAHVEAIILSMTPEERRDPKLIKASRKTRIAKGSGRSVQEVNQLLIQFEQMKKMMKGFKKDNMQLPF